MVFNLNYNHRVLAMIYEKNITFTINENPEPIIITGMLSLEYKTSIFFLQEKKLSKTTGESLFGLIFYDQFWLLHPSILNNLQHSQMRMKNDYFIVGINATNGSVCNVEHLHYTLYRALKRC